MSAKSTAATASVRTLARMRVRSILAAVAIVLLAAPPRARPRRST